MNNIIIFTSKQDANSGRACSSTACLGWGGGGGGSDAARTHSVSEDKAPTHPSPTPRDGPGLVRVRFVSGPVSTRTGLDNEILVLDWLTWITTFDRYVLSIIFC